MRRVLVVGLSLSVTFGARAAAAQDDFATRVAAAEQQAATPFGQQYQQQLDALLTPHVLGIIMKKCSLTSGIAPMDVTLVGKVSAYRTLQNFETTPDNKLAQCLGPRLTGVCYPWIDPAFRTEGYPIVLHLEADYAKGVVIKKGERLRLPSTCPGF